MKNTILYFTIALASLQLSARERIEYPMKEGLKLEVTCSIYITNQDNGETIQQFATPVEMPIFNTKDGSNYMENKKTEVSLLVNQTGLERIKLSAQARATIFSESIHLNPAIEIDTELALVDKGVVVSSLKATKNEYLHTDPKIYAEVMTKSVVKGKYKTKTNYLYRAACLVREQEL